MIQVKLSEIHYAAKGAVFIIMMLFVSMEASVFAQEGQYGVQIGDTYQSLDAANKELRSVLKDFYKESMICMAGKTYRIVHKNMGDINTANALKTDLEKRLPLEKITVVQLDSKQCFSAAGFLGMKNKGDAPLKSNVQNKINASVPASDASKHPVRVKFPLNYGKTKAREKAAKGPSDVHTGTEILSNTFVKVLPEVTTKISISNRDVNRITCMGGRHIKDVIFSTEKGLTTKINGSNAFLKFKVIQDADTFDTRFIRDPAEIFVICGSEGTIYTLITEPKDIPAQTIQLVSGKDRVRKNLSLFQGLALEEKIIKIMREAYRGEFPDTYTVKTVTTSPDQGFEIRISRLDREIRISASLNCIVDIDGEGFRLKEYNINLLGDSDTVSINEKDFLLPELSERPVGIVLDSLSVEKDRATRLYILEQHDFSGGEEIN